MTHLRKLLAESEPVLSALSDDDVVDIVAGRLASQEILVKDPSPPAPVERAMTGYFTLLKFLRWARSFQHLESIIGYRTTRLSTKGLLIYRFLRLPEIDEFELRATSITPEHKWDEDFGRKREGDLAVAAAYHQNTKVPSFDEVGRRNARESMALIGDNTVVKVYPLDFQVKDSTEAGYPHGLGIPQWRLTNATSNEGSIQGRLLFRIDPDGPMPWTK